MSDLLLFIGFGVVWFVLMRWVLPRFGVST
jgi:hypothetical protein